MSKKVWFFASFWDCRKYWFYKKRKRQGQHNERIGKYYGWLIGGMCKMNGEKIRPIKLYLTV